MLSLFELFLLLYCPKRYWNSLQNRQQADPNHPYKRLFTERYLAKKRIVKGIWIASGLLMLSFPLLPFVVTLGLFTTFLSFSILDESR